MGRNYRIDLREIGWENVVWMCLAQDRDQYRALGLLVSQEELCFMELLRCLSTETEIF
jgi:hypothetical protein